MAEPDNPESIDHLYWMFRAAYCWSRRGAQGGPATFEKLNRAMKALMEIHGDLVLLKTWSSGLKDHLFNIDQEFAFRMMKCIPRMEPEEMLKALKLLLIEFEGVLKYVCLSAVGTIRMIK